MLRVCVLILALFGASLAQEDPYPDVPNFDWDDETELDRYVNHDDGYWSYELLETVEYEHATVYVLNMTSQKWMDEEYSTRSVWWHWVGIAVPNPIDRLRHRDAAIAAVMGGSNRNPDDPPTNNTAEVIGAAFVANDTELITAFCLMVPNQPIIFSNDETQRSRSEDWIISWTWRTYLEAEPEDRNQSVILRAPMTKSAKRLFDTVSDFLDHSVFNDGQVVDRFFVGGGSKRGWTTWSVAAVDRRVVGTIPIVFSLLNIDDAIMAHYQALHGWSFAFRPYYDEDLTRHLFNPVTQDVWDMEDMFRYRARFENRQKYLIVATGDEFFLNQDSHYWLDGMPDPMHFWMVGNAEHTMFPHYLKIYRSIVGFTNMVLNEEEFPEISWNMHEHQDSGEVQMIITQHPDPDEVKAFRGETLQNTTLRDFRLAAGYPDTSIQPVWWNWRNQDVEQDGNMWRHETDMTEGEWVGHYIEARWDKGAYDFYCTTEVNIIPGTFPVGPCCEDPDEDDDCEEDCYGVLR